MSRKNKSGRQGSRTTASDKLRVVGNQKMPRGAGCVLIAFSVVAFGFGLLLIQMALMDPLHHAERVRSWKQAPCIVKETQIVAHRSSGRKPSKSYEPYAEFEFTYEGKDYSSSQFWLSSRLLNSYGEAKTFLEPFPKGEPAQCWVNPENPSEAVLNREYVGFSVVGTLFGAALAVIGFGGLLGSIWLMRKTS